MLLYVYTTISDTDEFMNFNFNLFQEFYLRKIHGLITDFIFFMPLKVKYS